MAIVAGGLGQPEHGAIVAAGLGASEPQAPGAMSGTAIGAATCVGTLSAESSLPPLAPFNPNRGDRTKKPKPKPNGRVALMSGMAHGYCAVSATAEAWTDWVSIEDDELLTLLVLA